MDLLLAVLKVLVLYTAFSVAVVALVHWGIILNGLDERRWR